MGMGYNSTGSSLVYIRENEKLHKLCRSVRIVRLERVCRAIGKSVGSKGVAFVFGGFASVATLSGSRSRSHIRYSKGGGVCWLRFQPELPGLGEGVVEHRDRKR